MHKIIESFAYYADLCMVSKMNMNTPPDPQLSFELQELYLQNKQWLSDVMFLEDETRFFLKIFSKVKALSFAEDYFQEIRSVNASLSKLEERRDHLKSLVTRRQHMLESIFEDPSRIGLELIAENEEIINEIKSLFISDKIVKKELYSLVESVIRKHKGGHFLIA